MGTRGLLSPFFQACGLTLFFCFGSVCYLCLRGFFSPKGPATVSFFPALPSGGFNGLPSSLFRSPPWILSRPRGCTLIFRFAASFGQRGVRWPSSFWTPVSGRFWEMSRFLLSALTYEALKLETRPDSHRRGSWFLLPLSLPWAGLPLIRASVQSIFPTKATFSVPL